MLEKYDRAKLLDEIWTEPVTAVAPRYQLSDAGLQKLCRRLKIPTPPEVIGPGSKPASRLRRVRSCVNTSGTRCTCFAPPRRLCHSRWMNGWP
jgi:hypothetical protein